MKKYTKTNKYKSKLNKYKSKLNKYKSKVNKDLSISSDAKNKQKRLRIIFDYSPSLNNDAIIYKNEFIKQNYKVEFKLIDSIFHNTNSIKIKKEAYYDVNLFLELLPFKCKQIFPSHTNLFMPNNELFIDTKEDNKKQGKKNKYGDIFIYDRYEELKSIDFVLCKSEISYKFFNFIKNEKRETQKFKINRYNYQTIYTKFTSIIMKEIQAKYNHNDNNTIKSHQHDPNLFIHLAGKSSFKNTADLVYCWIKNKGFLNIDPNIKLVITCYGDCLKWFRINLKWYDKNYNFDTDPNVIMNKNKTIAIYKNMTIYFKPIEPLTDYIDIITKANIAICISYKEGYGHYINEARYMKKFIITMDYPPMNELVKDKDISKISNGILLKNKSRFSNKTAAYKGNHFEFYEAFPDMVELRDSIIWCIKNKTKLQPYCENGRQMFLDDKYFYEDKMKQFIQSKL